MYGGSSFRCQAANPQYLALAEFVHLDTIRCRSFDVINGEDISFSVLQWLSGRYYKQYSLCLHGDSDVGKTQLALSLLSELSHELQKSEESAAFFIKVGTVDALRECSEQGLM